jgi:hypothetical protein
MKANYGYCVYGVDYSIPPSQQTTGYLSDSKNVVPNDKGLATGRNGSMKLNAAALPDRTTSFFEHREDDGTLTKLASSDERIFRFNTATGLFQAAITGLTAGKKLQWMNFGGKSICVNEGEDTPQYYQDSSTNGDLTGAPKGLSIAEWGSRIVFGGDSTNQATVTGCALNDVTDYASAGATGFFSEVVGDSAIPITGVYMFFDWLMIGKKNNLYRMTGDPITDATSIEITPMFTKSSDNIGFTSPWAITQVGKDLLFLDGFDIKSLAKIEGTGDVETTSVIPHFRDLLRDNADESQLKYAEFFHYKKRAQIWVTIPKTTTTHYVFVLDYRFKEKTGRYSVFPMGDLEISCFGGVESGSTTNIYCGDESGFIRQLDIDESDDGVAIDRYFVSTISGNHPASTSAPAEITAHERRKRFTEIEAFFLPMSDTLSMMPSYAIDLLDTNSVIDGSFTAIGLENIVDNWTGTGVLYKRIKLLGVAGNSISLKWALNRLNENFTAYPSNVGFVPETKVRIV